MLSLLIELPVELLSFYPTVVGYAMPATVGVKPAVAAPLVNSGNNRSDRVVSFFLESGSF
jgi:hypothetical protein